MVPLHHFIREIHALYIARVVFHSCREIGIFASVLKIEKEINWKYKELISRE